MKDSVILGLRSFMTRNAMAAMTPMKTTQPTMMPAKAPSDIFFPLVLLRLTVFPYVAVVTLPLAALLTMLLSAHINRSIGCRQARTEFVHIHSLQFTDIFEICDLSCLKIPPCKENFKAPSKIR